MLFRKKLDFGHFFIQIFLVKFRQTFFSDSLCKNSKGFPMVLQACCSKALAFLFLALFGGALEFAVFAAFVRFWKIAEPRVSFYYMPAYGATLSPASSVLRLLPLAGPLGEPLRQFWGPARNLYCQGQPRIGVYLGRVGPLVGPWRNRFGPGPDLYNRC